MRQKLATSPPSPSTALSAFRRSENEDDLICYMQGKDCSELGPWKFYDYYVSIVSPLHCVILSPAYVLEVDGPARLDYVLDCEGAGPLQPQAVTPKDEVKKMLEKIDVIFPSNERKNFG